MCVSWRGDVDAAAAAIAAGVSSKKAHHTEAGVAIVVSNELINYIWDINPINDRIIAVTLGYSIPIRFISAYAPTSAAEPETKEKFYKQLKTIQTKLQKQGPTYTMGDFNARVQKRLHATEQPIGNFTFYKTNDNLGNHPQDSHTKGNRELFIAYCNEINAIAVNTFFEKPNEKLMTFKQNSRNTGPPFTRENTNK
jgi:exonuclease III